MEHVFNISNRQVKISESRKIYLDIRDDFRNIAHQASEEFVSLYQTKYKDMEGLANAGLQDGYRIILNKVSIATDKLIAMGDYSCTSDSFCEEYFQPYSSYDREFGIILDQFMNINLDGQELEEYRSSRKANRGRLIGGGFGIEGAAKGIAMAGAANLAVGAVHGVFNVVGNMISNSRKKAKLKSLFSAQSTKDHLQLAIYRDVLNIHAALFDAMSDKELVSLDGIVNSADSTESDAICANIIAGKISGESDITEAIIRAIQLNPLNESTYIYLMDKKLGVQADIDALANFSHVNLYHSKTKLLKTYYDNIDFESEQAISDALKSIEIRASELLFSDCEVVLKKGKKQLKRLDIIARTFEGQIYDTRALVEMASQDKVFFKKIFQENGIADLDSLEVKLDESFIENKDIDEVLVVEVLHEIKGREFTYHLAGKIITKVKKLLLLLDIKARTFDGVEYPTRELCIIANEEKLFIDKSCTNIGVDLYISGASNENASECDLINVLQILNDREFTFQGSVSAIDELEKLIVNTRTFDGQIYTNSTLANRAAIEKNSIDKLLETLDLDSESDLLKVVEEFSNTKYIYQKVEALQQGFNEQLVAIDLDKRTVNSHLYDTREEADVASNILDNLKTSADALIYNYQSNKSDSFYVKGNIPDNKLKAFVRKANNLFDRKIMPDDIYAYIDETLLGGGDDGIGITHSDIIITKGDSVGQYSLSTVSDISCGGFLTKTLSFYDRKLDKTFQYSGTQGNGGIVKVSEFISDLEQIYKKGNVEEVGLSVTEDGDTTPAEVSAKLPVEEPGKASAPQPYKGKITDVIKKYNSNKDQHFFVHPNIPADKLKAFTKKVGKKHNHNLNVDDILVYYDETVFGGGDTGVALTASDLVVTVDSLGVFPLEDISSVNVSGLFNKSINFSRKECRSKYSIVLTQGNNGATEFGEILATLID